MSAFGGKADIDWKCRGVRPVARQRRQERSASAAGSAADLPAKYHNRLTVDEPSADTAINTNALRHVQYAVLPARPKDHSGMTGNLIRIKKAQRFPLSLLGRADEVIE